MDYALKSGGLSFRGPLAKVFGGFLSFTTKPIIRIIKLFLSKQ